VEQKEEKKLYAALILDFTNTYNTGRRTNKNNKILQNAISKIISIELKNF